MCGLHVRMGKSTSHIHAAAIYTFLKFHRKLHKTSRKLKKRLQHTHKKKHVYINIYKGRTHITWQTFEGLCWSPNEWRARQPHGSHDFAFCGFSPSKSRKSSLRALQQ
ncbi:hypothetical protein, unlikely [Trypanosoma brucei gambiense DAL972]|uniref:Uncharacterized protein n=1 Tax=Trypanosoma brucei gambiense (strain MHOM/CI/86/DAL972) TaxID=679716 RepID=D0A559_TRYB9|nr:hypothetical protein, unlikely [Trypanosoma brucei gambiense DAL972]CBH16403.1 hypothetical protein, unlikely [Trypanosoma brucei gambiense DAL972]|eukprot:XP_011778667.1 hypothetical protein, unlikely [Trypanosoma brucei gambiense DAL972]